jgi:hypothetical protein
MLNRGDLVELDDGIKYFVADIFQDLGKVFLTLSNYDEPEKVKFGILTGDSVVEIQNPKLIEFVANKSHQNLNKKEVLDSII